MQGEGLAWLNLNNPNGGCCVDVTWTGHKLKLLLEDFFFFFYQMLFWLQTTALTQGDCLGINEMLGKLDFKKAYKDLRASLLCMWHDSFLEGIGRMGCG